MTQRVLAKQAVVMQNRLEMVTQIVAYIHADVEEPVAHTPVRECDQPPAHTLAVPGTIDLTTYMGSKSA